MKRITYLISLISLILFVSCGSIFAQAPEQYVTANGSIGSTNNLNPQPLPTDSSTNLITHGWYYIDETTASSYTDPIYLANESGTVNIIYSGNVTLSSKFIVVPSRASVSFYQAAQNNQPISGTFSLSGNNTFVAVIGNFNNQNPYNTPTLNTLAGNFGNITFTSGNYSITSSGSQPALGSPSNSGGTIQIDQAAFVQVASNDNTTIGVGGTSATCKLNIYGTLFSSKSGSGTGSGSIDNDVNIVVDNQGYLLSQETLEDKNLKLNTGIVATQVSNAPSYFNAVVNGTVNLPTLTNIGGTNNGIGLTSNGTLTVNSKSTLNLGVAKSDTNPDGKQVTNFTAGTVNNYGTVNVNNLATPTLTTWNNYPGSTLSIIEGQQINATNVVNYAANSSTGAASIDLKGILNAAIENNGIMSIGPVGNTSTGAKLTNGKNATLTSANPNFYGGTVYSMDMDSAGISFYTNQPSDSTQDDVGYPYNQYQDLNFSAYGLAGPVLPSFFDYSISPVTTNGTTSPTTDATFSSTDYGADSAVNWQAIDASQETLFAGSSPVTIPTEYQDGYFLSSDSSSNWALIMTPPTGSETNWNLILASNGTSDPDVYEITAYPTGSNNDITRYPWVYPTTANSNTNTWFLNNNNLNNEYASVIYQNSNTSDTVRYSVATKNVTDVEITYQNQDINQFTINLDEASTVQFGYVALNSEDRPITGTTAQWDILLSNGQPATDYATVNENGVVRVFGPLPSNIGLVLSCTVQGETDVLPINVTGTTPPDSSIEPVSNPLYLSATQPIYNLNSNIVFMPNGTPATQEGMPNITYTLAEGSTGATIYNNDDIVTNNNNNTSTYTVTATTTLNSQQVSTTFDVIFTGQTVTDPTGITAARTLIFNNADSASQNVDASFVPETTSMNQLGTWRFSYSTSNPTVAIVDGNGNVTPTGTGTATITTTTTVTVEGVQQNFSATTQVTVNDQPSDVPATSITASPAIVNLAPPSVAEADHSQTITVTLTPEGSTSELTGSITPESVATLTDNHDGTFTVTAVANGRATITLTAGDATTTVPVIVSDQPVIASNIEASGTTPDSFSVDVFNVQPNPAIHADGGATVDYVSIFTWTGPNQNDIQCKQVPTSNDFGTYSYTPFEVNGNQPNTWYYDADNIYVQAYAHVGGNDYYLGAATPNYSWVDCVTAADKQVAYITYQENNGFNRPTVFDGTVSGTIGQHLQLEGLRVSSCIAGVDVVTEVHAQNIGWSATRS